MSVHELKNKNWLTLRDLNTPLTLIRRGHSHYTKRRYSVVLLTKVVVAAVGNAPTSHAHQARDHLSSPSSDIQTGCLTRYRPVVLCMSYTCSPIEL